MSKVAFKYAKPTEQGIEVLKKGLKFPDAKISVKNNCVQIDLLNKESLVLELKNYTPKNLSRKIHFWNAPKEFLSILKNCPDWENLRTDTFMKYNNMFTYRMVLARIAARILQHNNFRYVIFEKDLKNPSIFVSNLIKQLFDKNDIKQLSKEEVGQLLFVNDQTKQIYYGTRCDPNESGLIYYDGDAQISDFPDFGKFACYVTKTFYFPGEGTALEEITDRLINSLTKRYTYRNVIIDELAKIYDFKLESVQDEIIPFMEVELDTYGDPKEFGVFESHTEYLGKSAGLTDEQIQFMLAYHEMTPIDNPEKFITDYKANKMASGWELLKANPISQTNSNNPTSPMPDTIKVENLVELPKSVQVGQAKPAKLNIEQDLH
jgi:hypothetical protein